MKHEERSFLLLELQRSREFVERHWSDSLGRQFTAWVCQAEEELKRVEHQSELCAGKADMIWKWCQETAQTGGEPDDPQKVLKKEWNPPQRSR